MSNAKISEGNLIELQCGLPQLNRKVPLCLFLCISSWSSVKTLLCCSFLCFLSTFMSPRCLHSLFTHPSAASNLSVCLSSRFGPSFIFPSTELCILLLHPPRSTERMISPAASHLQQSHPISPALFGALAPHLEASGAQMRSKHLSPASSVFVRVKPVF